MELWELALLGVAGFGCGWINVMAAGGSLLTVPVMVFLGLPGPVANGTNRIAIIAQNIAAVGSFFRDGFSDFRLSASLAATASVGAFAGALVGAELEGEWFNRTIAFTMIAVLILMLTGRDRPRPEPDASAKAKNLVWGHVLMVGAGFWGGFIQIGVGFITMPILHRVMGLDLVRVNMHKVFIALIFSIVALGVFAAKVDIAWMAGAALAVGNALGGWVGARTAVREGAPLIRMVFYAAAIAMAIKLLFF